VRAGTWPLARGIERACLARASRHLASTRGSRQATARGVEGGHERRHQSPTLRSECPPESRRGKAVRGRGRAESHRPGLVGRGDIRPYAQSARLKEEPRSRASRASAARTCARVPEDQSARLTITGPLSGAAIPPSPRERSEKSRHPARAVPPPPSVSRPSARRVTGATHSGRPGPPAPRPEATSRRGPARRRKTAGLRARASVSTTARHAGQRAIVRSQRARPRTGASAAARSCSACGAREGPRACAPEPRRAASGLAAGVLAAGQPSTAG
jgi:hypothetical protein